MLDIRTGNIQTDKIKFADNGASVLKASELEGEPIVEILDDEGESLGYICEQEDAEAMIKALQKAIEEEWWE